MKKLVVKITIVFLFLYFLLWFRCHTNFMEKANLEFEKMEYNNKDGDCIFFNSSTDIFKLHDEYNAVTLILFCPLSDNDMEGYRNYKTGYCYINSFEVDTIKKNKKDNKFHYKVPFFFAKSVDNGSSDDGISLNEIDTLLSKKKCLECKVEMSFYFDKGFYYSNSMCIPKDSIIKFLNN